MPELSKYHEKHVRITDRWGNTLTGVADHFGPDYCFHEYGTEEDCLIIDGFMVFESDIVSVEEIEVHGTAELRTERLKLRRLLPEDAEALYKYFGKEAGGEPLFGGAPFETPQAAEEAVRLIIAAYGAGGFYAWAMDSDDVLFGAIGAVARQDGSLEVRFGVIGPCRGRGYAPEVLRRALDYLTEDEGAPRICARCRRDNLAALRAMEKAGMAPCGPEDPAFCFFEYVKK